MQIILWDTNARTSWTDPLTPDEPDRRIASKDARWMLVRSVVLACAVHGLEGGKVRAWAVLRRVCMLAALFQHTFRTGNRLLYGVLLRHQHAIPAFPWETFSAGNWERFCLGEFCAEGGLWCSCDKQEKLYKAVATFVEGNMDALPSNLAEECVPLYSILSGRRQRRRKATGA